MLEDRSKKLTPAEVEERVRERRMRERRQRIQTFGGVVIAVAGLVFTFLNGAENVTQATLGFVTALIGAGIVHPDKLKDLWPGG